MPRGKNNRADARAESPLSQPAATRRVSESDGRPPVAPLLVVIAVLLIGGILALVLFGGGSSDKEASVSPSEDVQLAVPWIDPDRPPPVVGAVDTNPADDSLWLGTNTGLFRVPPEGGEPEKVTGMLSTKQYGEGEISQELAIRFEGPNRILASGHPPSESSLPPALG